MACDVPDHASFRLLTVARRGSCGPTRKLILLVLQIGDAEKLPQAFGLKSLSPFHRVSKQSPYLTAFEDKGDDNRLVQLTTTTTTKY